VYNFIRKGSVIVSQDTCEFKGFDLAKAWDENTEMRSLPKFSSEGSGLLKPDFTKIQQFTRLTLCFDSPAYIHQVINLGAKPSDKSTKILYTYDLLAVRPGNNKVIWD